MTKGPSVGPRSRIMIKVTPATGGAEKEIELPLKLMVMGDFTGQSDKTPLAGRQVTSVNKSNFSEVMSAQRVSVKANVKDRRAQDPDAVLPVQIQFDSLKDFDPGRIAQQVPELAKLLQAREELASQKAFVSDKEYVKKIMELLADPTVRAKLEPLRGK